MLPIYPLTLVDDTLAYTAGNDRKPGLGVFTCHIDPDFY